MFSHASILNHGVIVEMAAIKENSEPGRRPGLFLRILKFCGVVLICLLFLEGLLRILGFGNTDLYIPDERLLWVPKPGKRTTVVRHQPSTISRDGFRYPVALGPKRPGEFRIFAFGDSVTMGWGVSDDQTYIADVASFLNSYHCPGLQFEGVNAGVDAYSNAQVNERLQVVFDDGYQPDIAIVAYSFNTEYENLMLLQGKNREALLRRVWLKSYVRQSALYEVVVEHLMRGFVYYALRDKLMDGSWNVQRRKPVDTQRYYNELEKSVATCRAHHVPMVLLLTPTAKQRGNLDPMQQTMVDFARNEHVPIANMIEAWKNDPDHEKDFMDHAHPTASRDELIAQELVRVMVAAGNIPCELNDKNFAMNVEPRE